MLHDMVEEKIYYRYEGEHSQRQLEGSRLNMNQALGGGVHP